MSLFYSAWLRVMRLLVYASVLSLTVAPARAQSAAPQDDTTQPLHFTIEVDAPNPYRRMLEEGLELARWQREERVTLPLLQRLASEARQETLDALAAFGYFSANVRSDIETKAGPAAVVHITVDLGPRTHVENVDIDVTGAAVNDPNGRKRIDTLRETWSLPKGAPFTQQAWDAAKAASLERLGRAPYAAARVADSGAHIEPSQTRADLMLKLDSGPVFHAGPLKVDGLKRYPASIVENFYPFGQGEPYDALKLDLFQRRLLETRYFSAVHLAIDSDPEKAAAAPLSVRVIEAPSQRIDTGITVSTNTGPGLTIDYGNADVFDRALRFRSILKINAKEQNANFTMDTPPRPGGVWDTYGARLDRTDIEKQITSELVVGYAYNWGLESTPSQATLAAHVETKSIAGSVTENNRALVGGYRRTFRTTEDLINPRRGVIGSIELSGSVPGLATRNFVRALGTASWLIPAGVRNDILLRGQAGIVVAGARFGIPSSFLFRTGGDQTVRGYAYQSIGVVQGEAVVGGRYLAVASAEYTRWITASLGAAVFVDAGDAFDQLNAFDVAYGYGIGVRWRSPIGPVRADVAYGVRTEAIRLHFSAGYTF